MNRVGPFLIVLLAALITFSMHGSHGGITNGGTCGVGGGSGICNPGSAVYSGVIDSVAAPTAIYSLRAASATLAAAGSSTTPVLDVAGSTSGACTIYLLGN